METKFLGQAYQSRSPILASQTCINLYPEPTEGNSDEIGAFYGTPGITSVFSGSGEVRGMRVAGGYLYAVIGSACYRIDASYTGTNLGTLPNLSGPVSVIDNGSQVGFFHQDGAHWVSYTGSAIASIANAPSGGISTTSDQYVAFSSGGQTWGLTAIADLSSINPLDVASAEGLPDDLVCPFADHRELWLFGDTTTEIWSDTGAAFFPFERAPGGFIEQGCAAPRSPSKLDNSVFWLGKDTNGQGVIYRANAYIPERISTHAVEYAINQYADISDAIGFSYQEEGHGFYWLTFPTGDTSWVYDVSTKAWHQRAYLDDVTGLLHRHRANCYATFNSKHLVGDYANGSIYEMRLDLFTDNGTEIYRERAWEVGDAENKKIRIDKLELLALTGDGVANGAPNLWLQVSKNGGRRFGYQRLISIGNIGQTTARVRWRRLGPGRNWVLRVGTSMASRVHWIAAYMDAEVLAQ